MTCTAIPPVLFAVGTAVGGAALLSSFVRYLVAALGVGVWAFLSFWMLIDLGIGDELGRAYDTCGWLEVLLYPALGALLGAVLVMIAKDISRPHPSG